MAQGSVSGGQEGWHMVVRRSFGIPDLASHEDAREALVRCFEDELEECGWQSAPRAVAQPLADSLMLREAVGNLDDPALTTLDRANRLIAHGIEVIDPEHLVYEGGFDYPPEIVVAAQEMLARVEQYVREQSSG